jgi:hypothetical protein
VISARARARRPSAVSVVVVAGLIGVLALLSGLLTTRQYPAINDNQQTGPALVVKLLAGGTVCQHEPTIPAGVARLGFGLAVYAAGRGGPLTVTVRRGGKSSAASRAPASSSPPGSGAFGDLASVRTGTVSLLLNRAPDSAPSQICLHNGGSAVLELLGDTRVSTTQTVTGEPATGLIGFTYEKRTTVSWWHQLGTIARRFALVKAPFFGAWTFWAVIIAIAMIWAGTIVLLRRALRA